MRPLPRSPCCCGAPAAPGVRAGDRLRPRRIRSRPCSDRPALEFARLRAHRDASLMQLAALFGVYALSLIAVLFFASPFAIWAPKARGSRGPKRTPLLALFLLHALALGAAWGRARLANADVGTTDVRFASCRPMSIRPINGVPRTRRDLRRLYRSHQIRRRQRGSTASSSWSGRRRRCRFCSPIPPRR